MTTPAEYAKQHTDQFVGELIDLLRIPSVSTKPKHKADMQRAAEWLRDHCLALGMTRAEVIQTDFHPLVYAEWLEAGPEKPIVLVYGHFDVQPADPEELWDTPAFEPTIRDGKLYARGATDDKGQLFIHLKVFEAFMKTQGAFPVNIKFILEGEEEMGSESLESFVRKNTDLLESDMVMVSDTGMPNPQMPTIIYGLRGLLYTELEVFGPKRDLHSGMYGGTIHNPAQAIAEIIASMHDADGHITVDGFYDNVRDITRAERNDAAQMAPIFEATWREEAEAPAMWGEPDYNAWERIGSRPTLEINGIYGGYTEKGGQKTVIPSSAFAKISCRLVADQDPQRIFDLLKAHIDKVAPPTIRTELRRLSSAKAVAVARDSSAMQVAVDAYEEVFGKTPIFTREGGSIPVVLTCQEALNVPVIMMGFGLPDDNLHAPNEKFSLEMFRKGIQTAIVFYEHYGQQEA
jgi:acetylornithine deacetylase/succinyl-diaminopimelate desuccinylase-like protein